MVGSHSIRVGLALGGGIVRGITHLGVLEVFEQEGIPIDCISGASVGSLIAAAYSAGWRVERIAAFARDFRWHRIVRPVWPRYGLVSFDKLRDWMIAEFGDLQFSELKTPCGIAATDVETGEPHNFYSGRLMPAVQASCSVPFFITPVSIEGRLYCDGGITNMLPVSTLRAMGATYVIGVDLFAFSQRPYLGPLDRGLAAIEIMLKRAGAGITQADFLIQPELGGKTYLRFAKFEELYEIGRQAARLQVGALREALSLQTAST